MLIVRDLPEAFQTCYDTVAGIVSLTVALVRFHCMCIARVEFRAYPTCLPQNGVRLLHPRAFGRILDGIGGCRADGPCQHAGHPPGPDRRLAPYPRLRNRFRHRRSHPSFYRPRRGALPSFLTCLDPTLQTLLAAIGVIVLLPLGIYFFVRAVKDPMRAYARARQQWDEGTVPAHLIAEVTDCFALTIFNPLTILYWVGVTSNWLPFAHSVFLGHSAPVWGILMTAAGLMTWFTAVIIVVRYTPHRIGPTFFRVVNTVLALVLVGFAAFCGIVLSRHFLHRNTGFPTLMVHRNAMGFGLLRELTEACGPITGRYP